jgi:hypothetical protein
MDYGQVELAQLRTRLTAMDQPAWLRAVGGSPQSGVVPLWRAEVILGPIDVQESRVWRYGVCTFVSATLTGVALAAVVEADATQTLALNDVTFSFDLNAQCNFQRKPCFAQFDEPRLSWPSVSYTLSLMQPQNQFQPPNGFLIGAEAPAFAAFSIAYRAFFTGNYSHYGASNPSLGQLVIRCCDLRGRINGVTILPTGLDVGLEGTMLEGAQLEMSGAKGRILVHAEPGAYTKVPLPQGLDEDEWLWLRSRDDWLDYRWFGTHETAQNEDVRDERPVEAALDLAVTIAQGEGQYLEFKRQLPDPASRRAALKTIVAFANGEGGTVLYGVDNDGSIIGLTDGDDRTLDRFHDILRSWTSPMPVCNSRLETFGDKVVLVVEVEGNKSTIHALTVDADKPEYFVRRGATTFPARPEELQAIARSQQTTEPGSWRGLLG